MPHTKSAKKNLRKTEKRRLHNRSVKKEIRTYCKRVVDAAAGGDAAKLQAEFVLAVMRIDKAAAKKIIHPNLAARKKSQLARLINDKKTAPAPTT